MSLPLYNIMSEVKKHNILISLSKIALGPSSLLASFFLIKNFASRERELGHETTSTAN